MTGLNLAASETRQVDLYLDLMKQCLTNSIYRDEGKQVSVRTPAQERLLRDPRFFSRMIIRYLGPLWVRSRRAKPHDPSVRSEGRDWPSVAHTMIGKARLNNIQFCVEDALRRRVPGDMLEAGVWRGGAVMLMRAILKAYGIADRSVWVADSFEGLPRPNAEKYAADSGSAFHTYKDFAVSLEQVKDNFDRYGLLDDQVKFLKGWFCDTLPTAPIDALAVLRLDGDMYESTMDGLVNLYPKVSPGGYVILDDYGEIDVCRAAVDDYRRAHGITDEIVRVDWSAVYWQRSA